MEDDDISRLTLLILAQLKPACGNYSTASRIRNHFESLGITCYLRDSDSFSSEADFDTFVAKHGVNAMLVLHAYRGGRWLCRKQGGQFNDSIPYAVIYGGTDLNKADMEGDKMEVISRVVAHASFLVVFSRAMRDKALSNSVNGLKSNNNLESLNTDSFTVIPQAPVIKPSDGTLCDEIRLKHSIPSNAHLFTLVTGIRPVKDPLFMVNTFAEWPLARELKAYLIVIGPELDASYSQTFHQAVSTTPSVLYLGVRSMEDAQAIVRDSYAVINCSKSEGQSSAILEAMALGVPVIARDIPGNTAIITEGQNGLLFADQQEFVIKAERLIQMSDLHSKLSESGRKYINDHHSIEKEQKAYISLAKGLNKLRPQSSNKPIRD